MLRLLPPDQFFLSGVFSPPSRAFSRLFQARRRVSLVVVLLHAADVGRGLDRVADVGRVGARASIRLNHERI